MRAEDAARILDATRRRAPLVQNITNFLAMTFSANALLALGASPAMIHAIEEAAEFAARADALVINIGTLSAPGVASMRAAAGAASGAGRPWVLDPVAAGATRFRHATALGLLDEGPTIVRANASEIIALVEGTGTGRGVDSADPVERAEGAAATLARRLQCIVAVTGPVDFVTDGQRACRVANGHPTMSRVTALGCALSATCAAFATAGDDPLQTTAAALAFFGVAGERAAGQSILPGSFAVAFLDALASLDAGDLEQSARIEDA